MKTSFIKKILIIIILFGSLFGSWANEHLRYELSREKINRIWIYESTKGHFMVSVQLKEPYKEYFADLTGNNIGKKLAITFSGQILNRAVIKDRIDSGIIQIGEWSSKGDAKKFADNLQPQFRTDSNMGIDSRKKADTSIRPLAKKYLRLALDNFGNYNLTNDKAFLTKGLALVDKAIVTDNRYILGYYWKAIFLSKLKEYEKAILTLNECINKNSDNEYDKLATLFFIRGVIMQKKGKKEEASNDYNRAIEIYENRLKTDPKNWDVMMNISHALFLMDKKEEAIKLLNQTIEKYPEEEGPKQILESLEDFNIIEYLQSF